jgi:two-component system, NarL family, nitrate/nitrite response regulator NarL
MMFHNRLSSLWDLLLLLLFPRIDCEVNRPLEVKILKDVVFYSNQPVLAAGVRISLGGFQGFHLAAVATTIPQLLEHIRATPAALILIDLTQEVTLEVIKKVQSEARGAAVILWVEAVSIEFASQVIGLGVRGILRKTMSIELHLRCLQAVGAGELWLEKSLSDRILTTSRVTLTQRERELLGLLAQGLKNKEMAHQLGITEGTVKVYLSNLFRKAGANDRLDLALFALRNMICPSPVDPSSSRSLGLSGGAPMFVPGFLSRPAA